jgi:hypothetical protein
MKRILKIVTSDGKEHLFDINLEPLDLIRNWVKENRPTWITVGKQAVNINYIVSMENIEVEGEDKEIDYEKSMRNFYKMQLRAEVLKLLDMWCDESDALAEETSSDPESDKIVIKGKYRHLREKLFGMINKL